MASMMMKKSLINLLSFILLSCLGAEEIVVHLPTDKASHTTPIYLARLRPLETNYLKELDETFFFDLSNAGYFSLLPVDEQKQFIAHQKDPAEAFKIQRWKEWEARYVIVPEVTGNTLEVKVFDVATAMLKSLPPITLKQNVAEDVRSIHKAIDLLVKVITGKEGIASKRILYSYQPSLHAESEGVWQAEIWEMDSQGKHQKQVTDENNYSITPAFIPDPERRDDYSFVYVTYKQGQPRLYMTTKGTLRGTPFVSLKGNQLLPAITRKRDRIAFISDASGQAELFMQAFAPGKGVTGKPYQLYSCRGSVQASPTFSPDGSKIAFVSDKTGTPRIYIININPIIEHHTTPDLILISKANKENTSPSWSPDGKKIAYSSNTNGVRQIWIYDREKREERQITFGLGNKENPNWAPDSFHLVYNSTTPTMDIYRINLTDKEPVRLTDGPGRKHYPVFEP
jgi:TolB protein